MDDRKLDGTVLLDFAAAFDVMENSILIAKLKCYGFSSLALAWMKRAQQKNILRFSTRELLGSTFIFNFYK